ncbi:MAG: DUF6325 family protein [Microbacteriaceae bacterium]
MADFNYGPAEFIVAAFDEPRPGPALVKAILDLVDSDTIRVLDLLFVSRSAQGEVTVVELEEVADEYGFGTLELEASGIAGSEDVEEIAELLDLGTSGAILVLEHTWARVLASTFFEAGGRILQTERIPAPVVNAVLAGASED